MAQLRPYGGEDFTINLVAVSVLREMGVLITAIMVAGRSGSAFTAEIGVMKTREEIDALKVMGIDPMQVLVVPRLIGLVITLPLLTFFADIMGLLGGARDLAVAARRIAAAIPRARASDGRSTAAICSSASSRRRSSPFSSPSSAACTGCSVTGSAESVGRETTRAVVKAIFLVIVLDALFSILFEKLGL